MANELIATIAAELATSSGKAFSAILAQFDLQAVKSLESAVAVSSPSIVKISRKIGSFAPIRAFIAGHIASFCDFVNLRASMNDDQIRLTAELVTDEFPHIALADISLVFRRAKLGQWGEMYGRIDGQMILGWFGKYWEERCEYCSEKSIQEATSRQGVPIVPEAKAIAESLYKNLKNKE